MTQSRLLSVVMMWCALCLTVLQPRVAFAEPPAVVDGQLTRIVVRGTRWIEDAAVLSRIGVRPGEMLTASKVRRDLVAIYDSGFFNDVVMSTAPDNGGVQLIVDVVEKPAVIDVRIEGNKKIDEEDIREVVDVDAYGVLNESKLNQTLSQVRDLYVEKGFYLAEVNTRLESVGEDQVEVVIDVVENRKVIIQRIEFSGNDNVADSKIKKYMQTKEGGFAPWLTSTGSFKQETLDQDAQNIQYVMLEEGYADAKVDPPKVYLSPDKRFIFISFHIDEGPQFEFGGVSVRGDFVDEEGLSRDHAMKIAAGTPVADIQEDLWRVSGGRAPKKRLTTLRGPEIEEGETFKYSTMAQVANEIARLYKDQGYAFVNVIPQPKYNTAERIVDVEFVIQKGEKVKIGRINITGNDPTFDKVIRRELLINEGDTYRGTLIDASRARLNRLGFFEEVKIATPRGDGPDVLDLNVKVSEQPTGSFSLGMGYSTLERFAVNASISKNNFMGLGYVLSAAVNWSRLRRQANVSFLDPYFLDSRWTFKLDGYWIERQFQLSEYQRGATLGVGRYLDRRDDVQLRLEYTIEDVGLTSLDEYRQRVLGGALFRNGLTSTVGLSLLVDKRNNRIFATKGFYATASMAMSGGFRTGENQVTSVLGGDFNFVEGKANLRFYQPLIPKSEFLVLRVNSTLGSVWSTDGQIIPFIHRYRAGGINSVRGFQWFSLGPTIRSATADDPSRPDDTLIVGGTQTWINNIEIEADPIRAAQIKGVVFFDAGNAFGDPWGEGVINPLGLRTSLGAGIRWRSPIGPLRFEWGFPLKPQGNEQRVVFDFSIGSFF